MSEYDYAIEILRIALKADKSWQEKLQKINDIDSVLTNNRQRITQLESAIKRLKEGEDDRRQV